MKVLPVILLVVLTTAVAPTARQDVAFVAYTEAAPLLDLIREDLWPSGLRGLSRRDIEVSWPRWVVERDRQVRARVAQGDDDSVVHLLLFGTSFTRHPRAGAPELAGLAGRPDEAMRRLRPRVADFVGALSTPGDNERLVIARDVVRRAGLDPDAADPTAVIRYFERRMGDIGRAGAEQLAALASAPAGTIFQERGLSSDTTISVNLGVERALEDLLARRALQSGSVRKVAVVGPGLDFIDKQHGYDFYPLQTIQPFAVVDSLLRVGLARPGDLEVTAFDVSPRVLGHLAMARMRARAGRPYTIVLPRDLDREWAPMLVEYWDRMGNWIADASAHTPVPQPPAGAGRVQVRQVEVRPDIVGRVVPRDVNIVVQRLEPFPDNERFDLVIATNILLYYDVFEQSLAMANIAGMLRPGGLLLSNSRIVELPGSPLAAVGYTDTTYMSLPGVGAAGDRVIWYQRP